jgi:hypothetical protein
MTRYAGTFKRVTSLVLAFLFSVSSPLSVAVAYAQSAPADTPAEQTDTSPTDQGRNDSANNQPSLNFTVTGEPGPDVTAPSDTSSPTDTSAPPPDTTVNPPADQTSDATDAIDNTTDASKKPPPDSPLSAAGLAGGDPNSNDDQKSALTQVQIQPDPLAGSMNYSYPLTVPPGTRKFNP